MKEYQFYALKDSNLTQNVSSLEIWFEKSGSRNLVWEFWFEKSGWPEKQVDLHYNSDFFQVREIWFKKSSSRNLVLESEKKSSSWNHYFFQVKNWKNFSFFPQSQNRGCRLKAPLYQNRLSVKLFKGYEQMRSGQKIPTYNVPREVQGQLVK